DGDLHASALRTLHDEAVETRELDAPGRHIDARDPGRSERLLGAAPIEQPELETRDARVRRDADHFADRSVGPDRRRADEIDEVVLALGEGRQPAAVDLELGAAKRQRGVAIARALEARHPAAPMRLERAHLELARTRFSDEPHAGTRGERFAVSEV